MLTKHSLTAIVSRMATMQAGEIVDRSRQEIQKRFDAARCYCGANLAKGELRYWSGVRPRFFFRADDIPRLLTLMKERLPEQADHILKQAEKICRHRFDLLGYQAVDYGAQIDWHCDRINGKHAPKVPWYKIQYLDFASVGDAKVTWEINRHQHLVTLAKAYRLGKDHRFAQELVYQWRHWQRQNHYPLGINWASSLEVGFRTLSWIWVYFLLEGTPAFPPELRQQWLAAIALNARHIEKYLSTYFSPNTHLLGEGVTLFFVGTLYPELRSADRWKRLGRKIIERALRKQVRNDGLYFEQSAYYHVYAVDFFLHTGILASINDVPFPLEYDSVVERMLTILSLFRGDVPCFGDDDGGRLFDGRRNQPEHMKDPLSTGAILFGRGDFKYIAGGLREETLWLLGEEGVREFDRIAAMSIDCNSFSLAESGLYVMSGKDHQEQIFIDAGPQGALVGGHGHADALSVTVSSNERPILIDSGTFAYVGDDRTKFRATAAHNTVQVDGVDQTEAGGPFSWKQLTNTTVERWTTGEGFDLFVGNHDGYTRLQSPVLHRRCVFYLKSRFWLVRDIAIGSGEHELELFWHLGPDLSAANAADLRFRTANNTGLWVSKAGMEKWECVIENGFWSPVYGREEPAKVLRFRSRLSLPGELATLFVPVADFARVAGNESFERLETAKQVVGYCYSSGKEKHRIFFGNDELWHAADIASDAEFLYWGSGDEHQHLVCCNSSFVEVRGQKIISSGKRALRCELVLLRDGTEVRSCDESVAIADNAAKILAIATGRTFGEATGVGA